MNDKSADLVSNRRATHDYEILETLEAGIVLQGTEIKSIRDHGATLQDAYVKVLEGETWLIGSSIAPYRFGNIHNHEEKRDRKLLLHKREIKRLKVAIQEKGLTIIPLALYLKQGRVKVRIAIAKGKKAIDKRADIKEKDEKRRMQQALKQHY
ncbi:SsrA-binding protein SmpB [Candidatus Protochlamydia phocaeensis]|uniref:SsrA-binding protein SmpB n=1 Tax=Candidatus Protochlamydia phocaeensis TaxID=1414722 RepID=UPI000838AE60|nr:SsrA-binding protein SmpB [Candidatus Protochlamydia phocaeensis]